MIAQMNERYPHMTPYWILLDVCVLAVRGQILIRFNCFAGQIEKLNILTNQTNSNSTCTVFDLEVPSLIGQLKI
jgi:hypothetical protein